MWNEALSPRCLRDRFWEMYLCCQTISMIIIYIKKNHNHTMIWFHNLPSPVSWAVDFSPLSQTLIKSKRGSVAVGGARTWANRDLPGTWGPCLSSVVLLRSFLRSSGVHSLYLQSVSRGPNFIWEGSKRNFQGSWAEETPNHEMETLLLSSNKFEPQMITHNHSKELVQYLL
jgi:hypothetical protein